MFAIHRDLMSESLLNPISGPIYGVPIAKVARLLIVGIARVVCHGDLAPNTHNGHLFATFYIPSESSIVERVAAPIAMPLIRLSFYGRYILIGPRVPLVIVMFLILMLPYLAKNWCPTLIRERHQSCWDIFF